MRFENINEPIEVIAFFDGKQLRPLRFRWNNRVYKISKINSSWYANRGLEKEYHFHISTKESDSFELIFNNGSFKWKLGRSLIDI